MGTSLRRLATTIAVWAMLFVVFTALSLPQWLVYVLHGFAGLTVLGILLEIREGGASASGIVGTDPKPRVRSARSEAPSEKLGPLTIEPGMDRAAIVGSAMQRARDFAETISVSNSGRVRRLLDELPQSKEDITGMVVFGRGLPFNPLAEVHVPYESPWPDEVSELVSLYELTYFETFRHRLNARLERSQLDRKRVEEWMAMGREAGASVPKSDRREVLTKQPVISDEVRLDTDPYQLAWIEGFQQALADDE